MLRIFLAVLIAVPLAAGVMYLIGPESQPAGETVAVGAGADTAELLPDRPRQTARNIEPQVSFAPVPDFVVTVEPIGPEDYEDNPADGAQVLLIDQQTDARGEAAIYYSRIVGRPVHPSTLGYFSQIQPQMDPATQVLEIHHAVLTRDGETLDMTRDVSVDFLRQENAIASGFFTGSVSVLIRIPGVRPNDVVDFAYSVQHRNPVLGSRHTEVRNFYHPIALERYHFRSLWPRGEVESIELGAPFELAVEDRGRTREFRYGPGPFSFHQTDEFAPPWDPPFPVFVATRFDDWSDVARWAEPYYRPQVTDEVQAIADAIMAEHTQAPERIMAALRHVQREISYFAVLLGEGGYVPLTPDETLRYGEGDCKAVTVLLISLLEAMGIDAYAALVSTQNGHGVDRLPATPLAFNHVIVAAYFNGRAYWLDPTLPEQGGRLGTLAQPDYGFALVARENTTGLTDIIDSTRDAPLVVVNERISIRDSGRSGRAEVELEWLMNGLMADEVRHMLRQSGDMPVLQQMANVYVNRFAGEFAPEAGVFEDDPDRNVMIYRWQGEVELVDYSGGRAVPVYAFAAHSPSPVVLATGIEDREQALMLPYPYHAVQTTRVEWPEDAGFLRPREEFYDIWSPSFRIESDIEAERNHAVLRAETRVLAPYLPVDEFDVARRALENEDLDARVMVLGGRLDAEDRDRLLSGSYVPRVGN